MLGEIKILSGLSISSRDDNFFFNLMKVFIPCTQDLFGFEFMMSKTNFLRDAFKMKNKNLNDANFLINDA